MRWSIYNYTLQMQRIAFPYKLTDSSRGLQWRQTEKGREMSNSASVLIIGGVLHVRRQTTLSSLRYWSSCFRRTFLLASCCAATLGPFASDRPANAAQAHEARVVAAWQARQTQFDAVRFRISGTQYRPAGYSEIAIHPGPRSPHVAVPARDTIEPVEQVVILDLRNIRLRRYKTGHTLILSSDGSEFVPFPRAELVLFNGKQFKTYSPHELNLAKAPKPGLTGTEMFICEAQPRTIVFDLEANPLLYACGIIHASLSFDPANLQPEIRASDFRLQDRIDLAGRPCLVLRTFPDPSKRFYEFWVDATDPRIIRQVHGYGLEQKGELWVSTTVEWQDTEYGPMPDTWEISRFESSTNKVAVYKMKLDDFEVNPAVTDADFDIDPPPGTRVYDETLPEGAQEYVVAAAGQPNLPVGEFILQEEQTRSRHWMLAGIIVVTLLIAAATLVYRRLKRT